MRYFSLVQDTLRLFHMPTELISLAVWLIACLQRVGILRKSQASVDHGKITLVDEEPRLKKSLRPEARDGGKNHEVSHEQVEVRHELAFDCRILACRLELTARCLDRSKQ